MTKFENHKVYWCIDPDAKWGENLPVVKPWQGKLHIYVDSFGGGASWTMHSVDSIKKVQIHTNKYLFHTKKEASYEYIIIQKKRLQTLVNKLKKETEDLVNFTKEMSQ